MASNSKLRTLAMQAAIWLRALSPSNSEGKEVLKLAEDLDACAKGCAACGSPSWDCPCEKDE